MRRRYVVAYDISDDKRRNKVFVTLFGYGDHAQYSVFFCDLNEAELAELRAKLQGAIHHDEDQVMIVELGLAKRPLDLSLEVLGRGYEPPVRTQVI